jgi:hypothetical protein
VPFDLIVNFASILGESCIGVNTVRTNPRGREANDYRS